MPEVQNDTGVRQCKTCGKDFELTNKKQVNCPECREIGTQEVAAWREKKRELDINARYDGKNEPTQPAAKRLLELRGLKDKQVIDTVYDRLIEAAGENRLPANYFLFANGIVQTLKSHELGKPQPLVEIADELVIGELSNRAELAALHDVYAWREDASINGHKDFDDFLRLRRVFKTDPYEAGLRDGGEDFEECQKNWAEFLPQLEPNTLCPGYTQRQMREWLDSLSNIKDFLIIASRNAMKSSFVLLWLRSLHLCCPDARALLVSETTKLSAGFIRKYRSFWEVKPHQESLLQKLFPEYCIIPGAGSKLEFSSPMAHLDLIQASATSTSCESVNTGGRAEVIVFDDPVSNLSCNTEEQRKKSVDLHDLLQKIREVNGSFAITIGTPWYGAQADGDGDLYAVLMKRNEESEDKPLAVRIDPIVTVKREAQHKLTPALLPTLTQEDVESYLLPIRMPWRFVKKEISANPTFALSQNFCIFPKDSDAGLRVTFEETVFRAHIRPVGSFDSPFAQTYMSIDRGWSVSKFADFSCVMVGKILPIENKTALAIVDCSMDRWKESELILNVVKMIEKHPALRGIILEKDRGWEELRLAVHRAAALRGLVVPPFIIKPIDTTPRSKMRRAKRLEQPLEDGRIWFASAYWTEAVMSQFLKFDGITNSNKTRKDDAVDCVVALAEHCLPRTVEEAPVIDSDERRIRDEEAEREAQKERMRLQHRTMFGGDNIPYQRPAEVEQPQQSNDIRDRLFGGSGLSVSRRT
jgi:hypothetical protein